MVGFGFRMFDWRVADRFTRGSHTSLVLLTCEISFGQNVCELMFGVNVTDLDLGVQLNPVKQSIRATLWVRETCLIVGLRPLIIIVITTSFSSKTYNIALGSEYAKFAGK